MEATNVLAAFQQRGFIQQITDEENLRKILDQETVTAYIGFDPTAESLHAGSLMPIMALMHMQRHGHFPIVVLGNGTAMIGDPSGKTEMRLMLYEEQIRAYGEKIKNQLNRYLHFDAGKAAIVSNGDWLLDLKYIDFLREIGRHFSVNRMLAAESYKIRLETGLSFLEFNYQLLQAYDFLMLFRSHHCILQMGGDDQWGNIVAGIDLIRRVDGKQAYGMTFPLLETAAGQKMGKTAKGALWLSAEKTSPYEFYQYWINIDDRDVKRFLSFFTLLPIDEIDELSKLEGSAIRSAKQILAYEATKITHGEAEAQKAQESSRSIFNEAGGELHGMPTSSMSHEELERGVNIVDLFAQVGLAASKSEARRLIQQGGCYLNNERIQSTDKQIDKSEAIDSMLILRAGKKKHHRVIIQK